MRILVADDDRELGEILSFALTRAGYEVLRAMDGQQALELFAQAQPALVLLDSNMPKLDGLEVCQRLRAQSSVPIIMLTVRNAEEEIVRAFELGADDYVTKPFSPKQLLARIKAALRRSGTPASAALSVGSIRLHPERHEVTLPDGEIARLTPLEFRLLHILMRNRGQVMSADQLVEHVWGHEEHVGDRILLKGLVRRLRQKVDLDPARPSLIKTVAGVGYSFVP
ncbi:MAG: response regulator transcription factor [Chloroflexi bacterium]|nr:MAG: response regulator transcription factor [Chloroflexota bacterium]